MKDQKEIIASNEKIARFMGSKVENGWVHLADGFQGQFSSSALIYDKSWNELMPVVIVCETMATEKINELANNTFGLDDPKSWRAWDYRRVHLSSNIDDTYKSIVEFIDWCNKQNHKPTTP